MTHTTEHALTRNMTTFRRDYFKEGTITLECAATSYTECFYNIKDLTVTSYYEGDVNHKTFTCVSDLNNEVLRIIEWYEKRA